ncbi:MAG TPA: S-methyl-5'-thioadenosine phosphorylase [Planctomycetes bacterium]|nr:S-methyl-5'-thioadenosine phosphorylase [Planctomycetota bacterium]
MGNQVPLAVLGGSGVYGLEGLEEIQEHFPETPFGKPSDTILLGKLNGVGVAFLPRHGRNHIYTPSEVPYRANLFALRALGVQRVLSVSAVGSLAEDCAPGDFVLVDQFVDRSLRRGTTFFGEGIAAHVPFGDPVCSATADVIGAVAEKLAVKVHFGGTYLCIEGPQFSTRAESELYRSMGATVVGMTQATEARLAREAGMAFACIAMVTDYDCWHPDHDEVDVEAVVAVAQKNAATVRDLVLRSVPKIVALGPSPWREVLRGAVMTVDREISAERRKVLNALTA